MKRRPGLQVLPDSFENYVMTNAQGLPIQLDSSPTTIGNELPNHGDIGVFGSDLYKNLFGITYKIPLTAV